MSSIAFSTKPGVFSFNLSNTTYDVPKDVVFGDDCNFTSSESKIQAIIRIFDRMIEYGAGNCKTVTYLSKYSFSTEAYLPDRAKKFYCSFNIADDLTLRTCFLLIKSRMLFDDKDGLYFEDACTNLFISIEGALRLIHFRLTGKRIFEIKPTIQHIVTVFPYGEIWVDLLEEIYDKRVQIVHPAEAKWMPELSADDFYDNYDIAVELVFYAVTGELLPKHD